MQNGIDTIYNFAVSYKVKYPLIIHQFYSQRKHMLTKLVYTSFIHNHQKLGLIQTYSNWQMNCDIILPHNGILLGYRKNCDVTQKNSIVGNSNISFSTKAADFQKHQN